MENMAREQDKVKKSQWGNMMVKRLNMKFNCRKRGRISKAQKMTNPTVFCSEQAFLKRL